MIPLATPNMTGCERAVISRALREGWVGPDGKDVRQFEEMVRIAAGRQWAVATVTGSAALEAAAFALGFIEQKIEVPRLAFPAMFNVLARLGNRLVLVEGGANHDFALYKGKDWPTIADRAPAIGEPPTTATLECYSFAANKTITTGQGGAVVGDDRCLERLVRQIIRQGYKPSGAYNMRMANINAALGCAQMTKLTEFRAAKRRIWDHYKAAGLPMIERGASRWMATADIDLDGAELGFEYRVEPSGGTS
ncbi:MAG: DegT/DnrJ/EryC1/StrS family aminotransferase, partial [Dongiaceae bacterium]